MIVEYILNQGADILGKKWRAVIIWHLANGSLRFSQLKYKLPEVSVKVLSEVLREMESNNIITRTQYPTIPVKVVYSIHPDALSLVEANIVCTIKIGEFLLSNKEKYYISEPIAKEITDLLLEEEKRIKLTD